MKKYINYLSLALCLIGTAATAQVKIGDNPTTVGGSSLLELESANKALVVSRVANTAAIASPVNGMIIYDLSANCFKSYQDDEWSGCGLTPGVKGSVLAQIGLEGDSPNTVPSAVTAAQLSVLPITGINPANETAYQNYIDANPNLFSSPATVTEVQNMITAVNAAVTSILAQIGLEGDSPNTVPSAVTASQLHQLPITGVIPANETAYQNYIDANPNLFSSPATAAEVQAMVTAVNAAVTSILEQIGNEGDSPNTVPSAVTADQLNQLPITNVDPANETAYQDYIDANPDLFSSPATVSEIQDMVTTVNALISILAQIGSEGDSPDAVNSVVTAAQLAQLPVTGVNPDYETAYQDYIDNNPDLFSSPATLSEVQDMITAVNASVTSILAQIGNEGDSPDVVNSVVTVSQLQQLPLTGINPANETYYQDYIDANPNLFSAPATVAEVQAMVTAVNATPNISGLTCGSAVFTPSAMPTAVAYTGSFSVPYTNGNGVAYPAGAAIASSGVTGLTATLQAGTLASGAGSLTYTVSGTPSAPGTASFAIAFSSQSCAVTKSVTPPALPADITLAGISSYFIASVYDQDYLPYTAPVAPATLDTNQAAGGANETLINKQGTLTTTGVTISIPFTRTGTGSVSLPAYSQTINIPAAYTEDGIARDITFSYSGAAIPETPAKGTISATLKSVGGILNVKKLDIQTGIGNDYLGFLLGQFTYSTDNSGGISTLSVRAIACIPDRNIANASHRMFYVPITSPSGKVWLNNNLGAYYSDITKGQFNPAQQATSVGDYYAYGSLFQWGRKADGHELISWTGATTGTGGSTTTTLADVPANSLFILTSVTPNDWRLTPDGNLWNGEAAVNNPCPIGFRVPTYDEFLAEKTAYNFNSVTTAHDTAFKFSYSALRAGNNNSFWYYTHLTSSLWTADIYNIDGKSFNYSAASTHHRDTGLSVRCIKN